MPIYKGSTKIGTIYHGGTLIKRVYKGETVVYRRSRPAHFSQTFTSNSTLTIPETLTSDVRIIAVGGGASGGGGFYYAQFYGGGGGGGSAGCANSLYNKAAISGKTITFTVGQGGASVTNGPNASPSGNNGGTTTVTIPGQSTMYGYGGNAGSSIAGGPSKGGSGGSASGGNQSNVNGNAGAGGAWGGSGAGGAGGASVWNGYGAGGNGGNTPGMGTSSSGAGGTGCVFIEYDYIEYF